MTNLVDLIATTPGLPCRTTDPELWYSDKAHDRAHAVALCRECPLLLECATDAIERHEAWGVWGATTAADRRSFRDGHPWRFDERGRLRLACASERAYRAHFAYREQPCAECRAAHEVYITAQRRARLEAEHGLAAGGSTVGYWLHRRLGEPACFGCLSAVQAQQAIKRARRGRMRARSASGAPRAAEPLRGAPAGVQSLAIAS